MLYFLRKMHKQPQNWSGVQYPLKCVGLHILITQTVKITLHNPRLKYELQKIMSRMWKNGFGSIFGQSLWQMMSEHCSIIMQLKPRNNCHLCQQKYTCLMKENFLGYYLYALHVCFMNSRMIPWMITPSYSIRIAIF